MLTKQSLLARLVVLAILLVVGFLLTYKNSPLNFINLFSRRTSDDESVSRVAEQQGQEALSEQTVDGETLSAPPGFKIEIVTRSRGDLRMLAPTSDGYLLVTEKDRGNVLSVKLADGSVTELITGLLKPSGLTFHDGYVWVAEETRVTKYRYAGQGAVGSKETVIPVLPAGGHETRTIGFGPDGKLYVAVGSSCNVCVEQDGRRAAITRYNADGSGEERLAEGLRNTVGFTWDQDGEMWGVDNGRDLLGDDLPPEEANIVRPGKHYGWPYCYGRGLPNPEYPDKADFCRASEFPAVEMQAHSAPLGLRFYGGTAWPARYRGNLFIAFHGSWNRTDPTGYKIVRVDAQRKVFDFITGWQNEATDRVWGRPVDIFFVDEVMYISDDHAGSIYRVTYEP